jgi:hypothetical protein
MVDFAIGAARDHIGALFRQTMRGTVGPSIHSVFVSTEAKRRQAAALQTGRTRQNSEMRLHPRRIPPP